MLECRNPPDLTGRKDPRFSRCTPVGKCALHARVSGLTKLAGARRDSLPAGGDGRTMAVHESAQRSEASVTDIAELVTVAVKSVRALLVTAALMAGTVSPAQADSSARVVETHPSAGAALGSNQSFWVRIEYESDEPVRLWARPFHDGAPVEAAMSNPSLTYTGAGDALGWFALTESGDVDEVRIVAGGGNPYREWVLASYPVALHWTAVPAATESRPQWVEDLLASQETRREQEARRRAAEPASAREASLFNGFILGIFALALAGIVVSFWSVWKWRGSWRIAAAVPAAVLGFVILRIIVDTARDPTSHNLWPFEIVMFGTAALVWIAVLKGARKFMNVVA